MLSAEDLLPRDYYHRSPLQYSSRMFPNYPAEVYMTQNSTWLLPQDVQVSICLFIWQGAHLQTKKTTQVAATAGSAPSALNSCPEVSTGRVVTPPISPADGSTPLPGEDASAPRLVVVHHDVSLCHIMGMGGDYVFVPFLNRLYATGDSIGIPAIITIGVLVVLMMVVMGHNLQVRRHEEMRSCLLFFLRAPHTHTQTCTHVHKVVLSDAVTAYDERGKKPPKEIKDGKDVDKEKVKEGGDESRGQEGHRWTAVGMWGLLLSCYLATGFTSVFTFPPSQLAQFWTYVPGAASVFVGGNVLGLPYLITAEDRDTYITTTAYIIYYTFRFEVCDCLRLCMCVRVCIRSCDDETHRLCCTDTDLEDLEALAGHPRRGAGAHPQAHQPRAGIHLAGGAAHLRVAGQPLHVAHHVPDDDVDVAQDQHAGEEHGQVFPAGGA